MKPLLLLGLSPYVVVLPVHNVPKKPNTKSTNVDLSIYVGISHTKMNALKCRTLGATT